VQVRTFQHEQREEQRDLVREMNRTQALVTRGDLVGGEGEHAVADVGVAASWLGCE
jgi:hypothetical protein